MPGKYYMGIDYRTDHSLRIPRPDLTKSLSTPNSCSANGCHDDKNLDWVMEKYTSWYGKKVKPHYGTIISAGRNRLPEAEGQLIKLASDTLYPDIVRATALSLLREYSSDKVTEAFRNHLNDQSSLLRYTAINNLPPMPQSAIIQLVAPKLYDPVKAVRIEAAVTLANFPIDQLRQSDRESLEVTLQEYEAAMEYNSDFAAQRYNLANLAVAQNRTSEGEELYRTALEIDDQFYPAKVNLAMLLNQSRRNSEAEQLLKEVLVQEPDLHHVSYSLGLLLAENGRYLEAIPYLEKAAMGIPSNVRIRYNYSLALFKIKKWEEGLNQLELTVKSAPADEEYFTTLLNLYLQMQRFDKAVELAGYIITVVPNHRAAWDFLNKMKIKH
jgi:tetratricopeptide (TPR) repeat protein